MGAERPMGNLMRGLLASWPGLQHHKITAVLSTGEAAQLMRSDGHSACVATCGNCENVP